MAKKQKYPSELAERFQVRLPVGLRDRIKAYAEKHDRSMNTEIVRILEREFPEPISLNSKVEGLVELLNVLQNGISNSSVERVGKALEETLNEIASGRVRDVDADTRREIRNSLNELEYDRSRDAQTNHDWNLDPEEIEAQNRDEGTAKYPSDRVFFQHIDKKDEPTK